MDPEQPAREGDVAVGQRLRTAQGHVVVQARLGQGGSGTTWLVLDAAGDDRVLKLLHLGQARDWKAVELFERETGVLSGLEHPGVPRLIDSLVDREHSRYGVVLERMPGRTLRDRIRSSAPLDLADFERSLRQCLEILVYLHSRVPPVVHRDISAANVLLDPAQTSLIDFGSVKVALGGSTQLTGVGTFGYMAPEQALGRAVPASDLYGLGMTFIALATGREPEQLPQDGNTGRVDPAPLLGHLPPRLRALLLEMIRPGPERRLGDAAEALRRLDAGETVVWSQGGAASPGPVLGDGVSVVAAAGPRARVPRSSSRTGLHPAKLRRVARWAGGSLALTTLLILLLGYGLSRVPAAHEVRTLGGWLSGHGNLLASVQATLLGDVYGVDSGSVDAVAFSPDGATLASLARSEIILWQPATGRILARHAGSFGFGSDDRFLSWSPDGQTVLASGRSWRLHLFEAAGARPLRSYDSLAAVRRACPTHGLDFLGAGLGDSEQVYAVWHCRGDAGAAQELVVLDARRGAVLHRSEQGGTRLGPVAFAADASSLAVPVTTFLPDRQGRITELLVIGLPRGEVRQRVADLGEVPDDLAYDAPRGLLAAAVDDGVALWDLQARQRIEHFSVEGTYYGSRVALDAEASLLALSFRGGAEVFDLSTGRSKIRLQGHASHLESVAIAPGGALLATGSRDQTIKLWELP